MSLRNKTLYTIVLTMLGLLAALFLVSQIKMRFTVMDLEVNEAHAAIEQAKAAIAEELEHMVRTGKDWSAWNDTYYFVQGEYDEYIEDNLTGSTLVNLDLNYMVFLNADGQYVHGIGVDLATGEDLPVPESFKSLIAQSEVLWRHTEPDDFTLGLIPFERELLLVSCTPVITSYNEGPIEGALVLTSKIDLTEIRHLTAGMDCTFRIGLLEDVDIFPEFAASETTATDPIVRLERIDDRTIMAYSIIKDVTGNPGILLSVEIPRNMYIHTKADTALYTYLMVGVGIVFGFAMIWLLQKHVLSRLSRLSDDVGLIGSKGDLTARISIDGNDELTTLSADINEMLSSLERSESALMKSEEHYRNLFETSLVGIWRVNSRDGKFIQANVATAELLGYENPERLIADCSLMEMVVSGRKDRLLDILEKEGQVSGFEMKIALRDSTVKFVSVSGRLYPDKGYIEGVFIDVTARKQAEEESARLAAAVEQAVEGIFIADPTGVIQYANSSFEKITGYKRGEVHGVRAETIFRNILDRDSSRLVSGIIESGMIWSDRLIATRRDGTLYEVYATVSPVRDESGQTASFVIVFRDVTQEVMIETQLRQAHKLEAIGQLAAGIAYEISTPTRFVGENTRFIGESFSNIMELLRMHNELFEHAKESDCREELIGELQECTDRTNLTYLNEEIPRAVAQSLEGIEHISGIVHAMSNLAHPGIREKVEVDINRAIESTITITRSEWNNIAQIETCLDRDLPRLPCYAGELNQVIFNLITYAAQAIADASDKHPENTGLIRIETRRNDDCAEILVRDNGNGIPEKTRDRIFDLFFITRESGRETGQGLAIVKSLVVKSGGYITFETETGVGTTFCVSLPIDSSLKGESEPEGSSDSNPNGV